jgi:hypothetical protein
MVTARGAAAQVFAVRDTPRSGSWEAGGGVTWTEGFEGASRSAELTRNGESSGGFDLFTAAGRLGNGAGAGATLGYYLSPSVAVEAGFRYSKPRLSYRLTGDAEDAPAVTAEETLTRYVFTGSLVLHLRQLTFARRAVPFLAAGAGYIRDLHEGNELVETGTEYHVSGGIKYWFGAARRRRLGFRGEAGVSINDGGFDFRTDSSRVLPAASASLIYLF